MLTRLRVRNFKRFRNVDIELGNPVVFIGPNNSGRTTALQALALWHTGLRQWSGKRADRAAPEKRPGVTINRRDLVAVPAPDANLLWRDLRVRDVRRDNGKQHTENIRIEIVVDGIVGSEIWTCGLEFDLANEESFYCRPLRLGNGKDAPRMRVPPNAVSVSFAYLQPMSGLALVEPRYDPGRINVLLGEGRTAEVLRNLCLQITERPGGLDTWARISERIADLFGVELEMPIYIAERGEVLMAYRNPSNIRLDLTTAGRGLQQTLLLLAHLGANPGSVLLLDEPDAHLEILRQRQIYGILTDAAREQGSQIIAASHSEVILNEAADRDVVVAFLAKPHRIDDRGSQLLKSLKVIGFDQYYQAEQTGWVLYLEGSTDLGILKTFATRLDHPAAVALSRPFVHFVQNQPQKARDHFYALREAFPELCGFLLCDRLDRPPKPSLGLTEQQWSRCEIENYLCQPETLIAYAIASAHEGAAGPVFVQSEQEKWVTVMQECISDFVPPVALRDRSDRWWSNIKASDDFLDRLFAALFERLGLPNLMRKTDYHVLARYVPLDLIPPEIMEKLNAIAGVAAGAEPASENDRSA